MMKTATRRAAEAHALQHYPRESCGVVVVQGRRELYIRCRNVAADDNDFRMPAEDYAAAEDQGRPVLVVHSHIDRSPAPTEADLVGCEQSGLPWAILSVRKGDSGPEVGAWHEFAPVGYQAPLVGRTFCHGSLDCYGLIKDFYAREMGIKLDEFDRPDRWWDDPAQGELYLDRVELAGFERVDNKPGFRGPVYGDVVMMQYRSNRTNHGGVFLGDAVLKTEPGLHPVGNAMLHHTMGRLSDRVVYGGYWADITTAVARFKG